MRNGSFYLEQKNVTGNELKTICPFWQISFSENQKYCWSQEKVDGGKGSSSGRSAAGHEGAITKYDLENDQLEVLEFWIFNVEICLFRVFWIKLTWREFSTDYSSVGRAGDCRGYAVISRSLVRIRLVGSFFLIWNCSELPIMEHFALKIN